MRNQRLYTFSSILFASFFLLTLYQNCSRPINDIDSGASAQEGSDGPSIITVSNSPSGNLNELDMNQTVYFTFQNIPGADASFFPACVDAVNKVQGPNCAERGSFSDPKNDASNKPSFSYQVSEKTGRFRSTTKDHQEIFIQGSETLSYYIFFGIQLAIYSGTINDYASKTFYIKPPHESTNVEEAIVWYSGDIQGRQRIWEQSNIRSLQVSNNNHYINYYVPSNFTQGIEVCHKTYQRSSQNFHPEDGFPAEAPSSSQCSSGDWQNLASRGDLSVDIGGNYRRYYKNGDLDFNAAHDTRVTYLRDASNGNVLEYATIWLAMD